MKKQLFNMATVLLLACSCRAGDVKNILFIAVDDLKPILGCYGDTKIKTPNIDRLAASGTVFLNNHCQQAVCGPSRASLMTGLRPDKTQVRDLKTRMRDINPDILSLPQYLCSEGFTTAGTGKIYDPRCVDATYDEPSWSVPFVIGYKAPVSEGCRPSVLGHYQSPAAHALLAEAKKKGITAYADQKEYLFELGGFPATEKADVPDEAYMDGAIVAQGIRFLQQFAEEKNPFFVAVGFKKPHLPFAAPVKYWDLYNRDDFELHPYQQKSSNPVDTAYQKAGEIMAYNGVPSFDSFSVDASKHMPVSIQKELIHGYYACVSYIDALVGQLLDELKRLDLDKNTVIVLWGDHGWHLGDHGLWCKHTNFEQATRSPLIVAAPGCPGAQQVGAPSEFVDIFPTLCELVGVPIPDGLDGTSLVKLMIFPKASVKDFAVSQWPMHQGMGYALRCRRFRYVEWIKGGDSTKPYDASAVIGRELYDYRVDPMETRNLADEPAYREKTELLSRSLQDWFAEQSK